MKQRYISLFLLALTFCSANSAVANQCQIKLKINSSVSLACKLDPGRSVCLNDCGAAMPQGTPKCFRSIDLPCEVVSDVYATSPSYQKVGSEEWVHINDLLSHPVLRSELFVLRNDLYHQLYQDFVVSRPPSPVGSTSRQAQKDNIRLNTIEEVIDLLNPLKSSAIFKRLSFGLFLEESIDSEFDSILDRLKTIPILTALEQKKLSNELQKIRTNELFFWSFLKNANRTLVASSRVGHLNKLVDRLVNVIGTLEQGGREYALSKIKKNMIFDQLNITECANAICFDYLEFDENFFLGKDQELTFLELDINGLLQEFQSIRDSIGDDLILKPSTAFTYPDFSAILNPRIESYIENPTLNNLKQLETAIGIAFLQQGSDGLGLFEKLKKSSHSKIDGHSHISSLPDTQVLLCKTFGHLDSDLKGIQDQVFELSFEARELIHLMGAQGHTLERQDKLQVIIARLNMLTQESTNISNLDRFTPDRKTTVLWNLDGDDHSFSRDAYDLQVEYVDFDGIHWIPSQGIPIDQAIPSIVGLNTSRGSLLPWGNGNISAMTTVELSVIQSPYTGCAENNRTVRLVLSSTDKNGKRQRHTLTALLDQI